MSSIFSWGLNKHGQCGLGHSEPIYWPHKVEAAEFAVKQLAVGSRFVLAVSVTGDLWSWGTGVLGELGQAYITNSPKPARIIKAPNDTKFKMVAVGQEHSLALTENGLVYSWGGNDLGQLGHGTVKPVDRPTLIHFEEKIAHIAAGSKHSIAISEAGNLYTWGGGWAGQLGDEVTAINNSTPKKLVTTDLQWKEAYGGENCSFAITNRGKVYSWGLGGHGRLGHGDTKPQPKPKLIEALGKLDGKVAGIAIGYNHSVARMDNGQLWVWGAGRNGELAQPTTNRALLPKLVPLSEKVPFKTIGVGYQYTIAVSNDGDLYAWGSCLDARLGNGKWEGAETQPVKLDVEILANQVFCGKDTVVIIGSGNERQPAGWVAPTPVVADAPAVAGENANGAEPQKQ